MHSLGLDPAKIPTHQTYRVEENQSGFNKKRKLDDSDKGFRGKDQASNQTDVGSNVIPLVPRNSKLLLLDIEGCTTSIAFVKQQLFPYVVEHVETYLDSIPPQQLRDYHSSLLQDLQKLPVKHACHTMVVDCTPHSIGNLVKTMVSYDVKATGLKALQGDMWKAGYHDGSIQGHVYPDFKPMLEWCRSQEVKVYIYSSGSIAAQKLLFGHSVEGNLNNYLSGYFDTTSGSKREAVSYVTIAKSIGMKPSDIVFCSDAEAELVAAREAGIGHVVMTIRPGNEPLSETGKDFVAVHSLMQLCGL
jgi:2,3-diketo-5-methylthio-1-phosphopentane phosphatase